MLQRWKNLLADIKFLLRKTDATAPIRANETSGASEPDADEPTAVLPGVPVNPNLLHPPTPRGRGVKRNIIVALASLFIAVFLGSFFFSFDSAPQKKDAAPAMGRNVKNPDSRVALPDTYEELAKYQQSKPQAQNVKMGPDGRLYLADPSGNYILDATGQPILAPDQKPTAPKQTPVQTAQPYQRIPAASYPQQSPRPYAPPPAPPKQTDVKQQAIADAAHSPIKFSVAQAAAKESADSAATAPSANAAGGIRYRLPQQTEAYQLPPNALQAGALIPATLITGINSDLSGEVVAQVRQNVYDSLTGAQLLIPQGARLLGEYRGGNTANGQERIAVIWKVLYLPSGLAVNLGEMNSVDHGGVPGMADKVDKHTGRLITGALATSLLAAGAQIAAGNVNADSDDDMSYGQLSAQGAANNLMNAGTKLLERDMAINPTILIRPGFQFFIFLNRDLILQPYENERS